MFRLHVKYDYSDSENLTKVQIGNNLCFYLTVTKVYWKFIFLRKYNIMNTTWIGCTRSEGVKSDYEKIRMCVWICRKLILGRDGP